MGEPSREASPGAHPQRHPSLDDRFDPAIRIVDHDPGWAQAARMELDRIAAALGRVALRLEHVGSTSVAGLAAKPILDLQLSVRLLEPHEAYQRPLERLGYMLAWDPDSLDGYFFGRPPERPRTQHLHVCEAGGDWEFRTLAVRDYLRAHPIEAHRYGTLKRRLAERHPCDRLEYIAGKGPYMADLEARATAWARATGSAPEVR
jgi:GrpB-like predicted nucleotidyltransferase (UPF0157 family)